MKRHNSFGSLCFIMILTVTVVLLTFCSREKIFDVSHIPMTLATNMNVPNTKATVHNVWDGGEQVQVNIDNAAAITFTALPNGTLAPVSPLFWQDGSQSISARAWHPASWTFPVDQSAGLQPADFIFASTVTGITASNYSEKPLVFRHRTAKVTVILTAGTDISNLNGATVGYYGYNLGVPDTDATGDGLIAGSGNGWISPQNTNSDTYTALLIPRDMTGLQFVKITIGENDWFYIPTAGQAVLQQGIAYAYNITVHRTRIKVEVADGIMWTAGSEYNITPVAQ